MKVTDAIHVGMVTWEETRNPEAAIRAALAVAPDPAPDDAFENAVSRFGVLAEDVGTVRTSIWSRLPESEKGREAPPELVAAIQERDDARARILSLHRQATHAGLERLKAWCAAELLRVADDDINRDLYDQWGCGYEQAMELMVEQIDTLLKEATNG